MKLPQIIPQNPGGARPQAPTATVDASLAPQQGIVFGRQVAGLGDDLARIGRQEEMEAQRAKAEADEAELLQAESRYADAETSLLHDPERGYFQTRGQDAGTRRKEVLEQLRKERDRIAQGITSQDARNLFTQRADVYRIRNERSVLAHEAEQMRVFRVGATEAALATEVQRFQAARDPELAAVAQQRISDLLTEVSGLRGESPEEAQQRRTQTMTVAHSVVIDRMVQSGDVRSAKNYYDTLADDEIDPAVKNRWRATFERYDFDQRSTEAADFLATQGANLMDQKALLDTLVERGDVDRELADAAWDKRTAAWRQQKQIQAEAQDQILEQARRWLLDNPTAAVSQMPPQLWASVSSDSAMQASINEFAVSRGRFSADPVAFEQLENAPDEVLLTYTPAELRRLRGRISDRQLVALLARRRLAENGGDFDARRVVSIEDRLKKAARTLKILPDGQTPNRRQLQAYDEWAIGFDQELQNWQNQNKRRATDEDIQKMLDLKVSDRVQQPGFLSSSEVFLDMIPRDEAGRRQIGESFVMVGERQVRLADIKLDEYEQIAQTLSEIGKQPTAQEIATMWVSLQQGELEAQEREQARLRNNASLDTNPGWLPVMGETREQALERIEAYQRLRREQVRTARSSSSMMNGR